MFTYDISNGNKYCVLIISSCNCSSYRKVKVGNDQEIAQSDGGRLKSQF